MNLVLILSFAALVVTISSNATPTNYLTDANNFAVNTSSFFSSENISFSGRSSEARGPFDVFKMILSYIQSGFDMIFGRSDKKSRGARKSSKTKISYKNYQVYRLNPKSQSDMEAISGIVDEVDDIKFWTKPVKGSPTDILIPPDAKEDLKDYMREKSMNYDVLVPDVQKLITYENPKMTKEQKDYLLGRKGHPMTWSRYHRYGDMLRYAEFLVYSYPHLVELETIGYSTKGLPLKVVKISSESRGELDPDEDKPAVWIDGGMHGREWITSSVVMYIVRQLVENYDKNKRLVDNADWYLMPVANPDGYEYSHTTDRLWTKTRSDPENSAADIASALLYGACEGVNLDYNFDYHWGEAGTSDDPCSDFYAGPRPYSEPESKAIADYLLDKKDQLKLYLSLHAYSQQWLLPSTSNNDDDYGEMVHMAKKAVEALSKVAGTKYDVMSARKSRPSFPGSSENWARGVAGVKYSYRVELRDTENYGYLLPATEIIPTARETFAAIRTMAKSIVCKS